MGTEVTAKVDEAWVIKRMVGRDLYVNKSPRVGALAKDPRRARLE